MKDEFDQIMDYFSCDDSEKEEKVEQLFAKSSQFLEQYKHVQSEGTEAERDEMRRKMEEIHKKLSGESEKVEKEMGLKAEEIKQLSSDSKNFTERQWSFLQNAKQTLQRQNAEILEKAREAQSQRLKKIKGKTRRKTKRKDWMKS